MTVKSKANSVSHINNDFNSIFLKSTVGPVTLTWQSFTHLIWWSVVALFHNVNLVQKTAEEKKPKQNTKTQHVSHNLRAQILASLQNTIQLPIQLHYRLSGWAITVDRRRHQWQEISINNMVRFSKAGIWWQLHMAQKVFRSTESDFITLSTKVLNHQKWIKLNRNHSEMQNAASEQI